MNSSLGLNLILYSELCSVRPGLGAAAFTGDTEVMFSVFSYWEFGEFGRRLATGRVGQKGRRVCINTNM